MIDHLVVEHALDAGALEQVRDEMTVARGDPATVLGLAPQRRVASSARKATHVAAYGPGDYFVAHQDGGTPLVHDDSRFRKASVVICLSAPGTLSGGSLMLHASFGRDESPQSLAPAPATLVAFPSETTHEVLPITDGERLSVVSWYPG